MRPKNVFHIHWEYEWFLKSNDACKRYDHFIEMWEIICHKWNGFITCNQTEISLAVILVDQNLPFRNGIIESGCAMYQMKFLSAKRYQMFDKGFNNIWLNKNINLWYWQLWAVKPDVFLSLSHGSYKKLTRCNDF